MDRIGWWEKCHPLIFNSGLVRVMDPDMNLNQNAPDKFEVKVWSDSDLRRGYQGGVFSFTAIETGNSAGIFESIVFWGDPDDDSLGSRIPIWNGTTVTALYTDYTLPTPGSKLNITSSLAVRDIEPIYKKLHNGTLIPYYVYDPCMMPFLDAIQYQFSKK